MLKTQLKQLLGSLPLDNVLPAQTLWRILWFKIPWKHFLENVQTQCFKYKYYNRVKVIDEDKHSSLLDRKNVCNILSRW